MLEEIKHLIDNADAVLFDMDGVIVDTDHIHADSKYAAVKSLGIEINEAEWRDIDQFTSAQIFQKLLQNNPNIKINEEEFVARKSKIFAQMIANDVKKIPGAFEFVDFLRAQNKKVALVTASRMDTVNIVLKKFDLKNIFDVIISRENVANAKPDPECYLKAAKLLDVNIENCVVFEDSFNGIASGVAAGAKVVGRMAFRTKTELLDAGAIVVFKDYSDLLEK